MSSNYYEQSEMQAELGKELRALGWLIFGWHEAERPHDLPDDCWRSASWDGIATKGAHVAGVMVSGRDVREYSGKDQTEQVSVDAGPCPRCNGTTLEPNGIPLEAALAQGRAYFSSRNQRAFGRPSGYLCVSDDLIPKFVRQCFTDDGQESCCAKGDMGTCSGRAHKLRNRHVCTWPAFQATPPRRKWHVECGGRIIASGIGLCANETEEQERERRTTRRYAHLVKLAAKIDGLASGGK